MSILAERLRMLQKQLGLSLKDLVRPTSVKYTTLHRQMAESRHIPFATIDDIAQAHSVPLNYFSQYRPVFVVGAENDVHKDFARAATAALRDIDLRALERGLVIDERSVMNWLEAEGGVLRNFDHLIEVVDLFHPAETGDTILRPHRLGKYSLATIFAELESEDDYIRRVRALDPKQLCGLLEDHLDIQRRPGGCRVDHLDIAEATDERLVAGRYRRVMAAVRDVYGRPFTLVYARLTHMYFPTLYRKPQKTTAPSTARDFAENAAA